MFIILMDRLEKALDYYNQALPITREVGDRRMEATTLTSLGVVYAGMGKLEEASKYLNQALPIDREMSYLLGEASTLNNLGAVYAGMGKLEEASKYLNQALPILQELDYRSGEANTLGNLAQFEQRQDNLTQALKYIEQAIDITEETRSEIISPDIKTSYFSSVYNLYQLYIDILMELHEKDPNKGYDAQAFAVSERSRARTLIELLTEANADIEQGIDPKLKEEEQSLRFQINAAEKQKLELFIKPDPDKMDRFTVVQEKLDTLNAQYQDLKNRIRATSPRYAALQFPQPLNLAEVQNQVLDTDTTLLQFALGEERSYVWVVTKDTMKTYLLPQSADIEAKVTAFSQWLGENPDERDSQQGQTAGQELSEMLFSQFATELTKKRLVIVSDGALHNIPFAALPFSKNSTLINNYEIVHLPSSSSLAIIREQNKQRQPAPKALAIFADAVYRNDDQRLKDSPSETTTNNPPNLNILALNQAIENVGNTRSGSPLSLKRLKHSQTEAQTIQTYLKDAETVSFFDFDANLENAQETDLSPYQIIHFASHGILDTERPELSGIVLSLYNEQGELINGYLRLNEIFNLNLTSELVVLSACETGLGKDMKGEGLIGLTRGFMYAGSPRVLVSLWQINDEGTSEFMRRFYRLMLEENLTPVQALKAAQLEMQQTEKWSDPYYWAAFTLQGEWNQ
ncbi:CHAT domain-containing protein [Crocosphaera watsonii]